MRELNLDPRKIKAGDYVFVVDCLSPFSTNGTDVVLGHTSLSIVKCRVVKWQSVLNSTGDVRTIVWSARLLNTVNHKEFAVSSSSIDALFRNADDALTFIKEKAEESHAAIVAHEKRQIKYRGLFHVTH